MAKTCESGPDLGTEFEACAKDEDAQVIYQGREEISCGRRQVSSGFQQCNGLLLINAQDGVTLFKHAGPRATEVFAGGGGIGVNFQENYELFMTHAQNSGRKVIAMPFYGSISAHRQYLVMELQKRGQETGIAIEVADPVYVPSTSWKWALSYNPRGGYAITKHYESSEGKDVIPVYRCHAVPGLESARFDKASAQKMQDTIDRIEKERDLKYQIDNCIFYSQHQKLEEALKSAQDTLGREILQRFLSEKRAGNWGGALKIRKTEFKHRGSESGIPDLSKLQCLETLSRFDSRDADTLKNYISFFLDNAFDANNAEARNYAFDQARRLAGLAADPRIMAYVSRNEENVRGMMP